MDHYAFNLFTFWWKHRTYVEKLCDLFMHLVLECDSAGFYFFYSWMWVFQVLDWRGAALGLWKIAARLRTMRVARLGTDVGMSEPCLSCTTFNILAPIYKRLDKEVDLLLSRLCFFLGILNIDVCLC